MQNCLPPAPSGRLRLQPLVKPGEAPTDSEGTSHPMSRISDGSAEGRIALAVPQGPGTPDDGPAQENSKSAQAPPITPTPQPEGFPAYCRLAAPHPRGLSASLPVGARCHRPEPEPSMEQQPGPGARLATMQSGRAPACQWTACRIGLDSGFGGAVAPLAGLRGSPAGLRLPIGAAWPAGALPARRASWIVGHWQGQPHRPGPQRCVWAQATETLAHRRLVNWPCRNLPARAVR